VAGIIDPKVEQYILRDADEKLIVEVRKHWIASFLAAVRLAIGLVIFVSAWAFEEPIYWIFFVIGLAIVLQALWRILEEYRDRFVITNQRVFRVHGVLNVNRATVPLLRILDITVKKPLIGRWLNYGHFVFESAAQVQGLNEIRYVADIDEREHILRKVMQGEEVPVAVPEPELDDGT
jgi:membrane protein YdbS with pleckstrin-like domain